jgi:hypothetical protein
MKCKIPSLYAFLWVPGLSRGVKNGRGVTLTHHSLLVPWSRKGRAIPLLPLWAVRPVQDLSACTRVHFTFSFRFSPILLLFLRFRVQIFSSALSFALSLPSYQAAKNKVSHPYRI